jgi:hypothetical protein
MYRLTISEPSGTEASQDMDILELSDELYALGCSLRTLPLLLKISVERIS